MRAGLRHARGRGVIVMDADFEHPPELIPKLIAAWKGGAKIVATRRDDEGVAAGKRLSSQLYYKVLDAIGDVRIEPGSADYMLLDRAVVDVINGLEDQDIFLRGLVRWLGFPLVTIPYTRGTRQSRRQQVLAAADGGTWRSPASRRTACGPCASRSGSRSPSRC